VANVQTKDLMTNRVGPRLATVLGLLVLCAASVVRVSRPPRPVPATAPDTVFSAERAMRHVDEIGARPHAMGMPDHDRVRDYIVTQLVALGLKPQLQTTTAVGTRYQSAGRVQNIIAWLPGSSPSGKSLLLAVHYDGVEAGPAAADDAAGCAALLETLRALRARKQPLADDVIALFTDGEEAGLLGAAAFVREHRWAKDVAFALNFEARGTSGRSYMFETGANNRDAASVLRAAGDVTAGSMFTAVYRALPNDTDLSELSLLGIPALNFAFADGVERYHTSHDDVAHLNPGSLQHHGAQMLALTKRIASEPLPRPATGDAVFFDFPVVGLVVYPLWLAIPLVLAAVVLTIIVVRRQPRGVLVGAVAVIVALVVSGLAGRAVVVSGRAEWSGISAASVALAVVALNIAVYALATRWAGGHELYAGVLVVWLVLALASSILAPGTSYLFTWPLLFALAAARSRRVAAEWIAAAVALMMLAGLAYAVSAIMLGVSGIGAMALALVTTLVTWLLLPLLERVLTPRPWRGAIVVAAAAGVVALAGAATLRPNVAHPIRTSLVYAEDPATGEAWLGSFAARDAWTRSVLGTSKNAPVWTALARGGGRPLDGRQVQRAGLQGPSATLLRDTLVDGARRVVFRVNVPAGTTTLILHATGAPVLRTAIDARVVDTTRFRRHLRDWAMEYWAVPDSGAVFSLAVPVGRHISVDLVARRTGLPSLPGVQLPQRPAYVVPAQSGDVSVTYTRVSF
jgi:hypothetical protein